MAPFFLAPVGCVLSSLETTRSLDKAQAYRGDRAGCAGRVGIFMLLIS